MEEELDCPRYTLMVSQATLYDKERRTMDEKIMRKNDRKFREKVGPIIPVASDLSKHPVDALLECKKFDQFEQWINFALGPFFNTDKCLLNFAITIPRELLDLLATRTANIMQTLRMARQITGAQELPAIRRYFNLKLTKDGIPLTFYDPPRKRWEKLAGLPQNPCKI